MVVVIGWWEVAIGLSLLIHPFLRVAVLLLVIRLPGVLLAVVLEPDVCFVTFSFAPTPEGQYPIKDLAIFVATLAIASFIGDEGAEAQFH